MKCAYTANVFHDGKLRKKGDVVDVPDSVVKDYKYLKSVESPKPKPRTKPQEKPIPQ